MKDSDYLNSKYYRRGWVVNDNSGKWVGGDWRDDYEFQKTEPLTAKERAKQILSELNEDTELMEEVQMLLRKQKIDFIVGEIKK